MDSNDNDEFISTSLLPNSNHGFIIHKDELDDDVLNDGENSNSDAVEDKLDHPLREQDRFLPIANIAKIMKRTVPETGKIAKDARECVQECVSEFISFITSEASERCYLEKRKTINGEDILFAMATLGFDNYVEPLKQYLQKYREVTKGDKCLSGLYEEITHESFANASLNENGLGEHNAGDSSILYTYTDQVPSFNLQ